LLGAPGVGKGTQAVRLSREFGWAHISTGDILRGSLQKGTLLGQQAKLYMERGELVPDDVIIGLVKDRIQQPDSQNGFILDGFPRTVPQAEQLEKVLEEMKTSLDGLVSIDVPEDEIVERLSHRLVCTKCGAISTLGKNVEIGSLCSACGSGQLTRRKDDEPDTIKRRLTVYYDQTRSLTQFYYLRGQLKSVDGTGSPDKVYQKICDTLGISTERA
jgi:adenylate kinase